MHKEHPQNLTGFDPFPPVFAYFGLSQTKINSSVRIWQTPSPPRCGRPLRMTPKKLNIDNNHV